MSRIFRWKHVAGMFLGLVLCFMISEARQAPAGPPQGAAPAGNNARAGNSAVMDGTDLLVQRRRFEAGNRSFWHSHERGFLLLVEEGKARVQTRGGPMKELAKGESYYTAPNVEHWHGAAPNESFIQVGVSFGGGIKFLEEVTDAEYQGRAK